MRKMQKFLSLSFTDQCFLLRVGLLMIGIRLGLSLLPFGRLRHWLALLGQWRTSSTNPTVTPHEFKHLIWTVEAMGRLVLRDRACLTQALVGQLLLQRRGYPAHLCIGVAQDDQGVFHAHAWVESQGKVIIGGQDSPRYFAPLPMTERPLSANRSIEFPE